MKLIKQNIVTFLLLLVFAVSAHALEREPYTQERFETLQAAGEVVLVDIHADWCSTCAKQQAALEKYRAMNPNKKFHILKVDFDAQKDLVRQFRAPRQSTFLLYKGNDQFWYSVAETRYEVIAAEIDKAIYFKTKK
ncbi:MAG: thioredoxin family protein [Methylophilaceae bacterium]|nr:thioredoxin family protein [Methylophilaceae bacterium]